MLRRLAGISLVTIVLASVIGPAVANDGADSWFKRGKETSSSLEFGVGKVGSPPARSPGKSGPRASGVDQLAEAVGGIVRQLPPFDYLRNACRANPGAGANVPVSCRSGEPADPADPDAPAGGGAPAQQVDAGQLAERAAGQLELPTPNLNTSPADPVKALVGLETWLWVPAGQWETLTASAEAGGAEVTVTAEPMQSRWDMGEGTQECAGPGREWRKGLGQNAKTSCSYMYKRTSVREPDKKYDVSATLRYRLTWECEGDCSEDAGDLGTMDSPTSTGQLQVSERQSVVIR